MGSLDAVCKNTFPNADQKKCVASLENYINSCKPSNANPRGGCQRASSSYTCNETDCLVEAIASYAQRPKKVGVPKTQYISFNISDEITKLSQAILATNWPLLENHLNEIKSFMAHFNISYKKRLKNYLEHVVQDQSIPFKYRNEMNSISEILVPKVTSHDSNRFTFRTLFRHKLGSHEYGYLEDIKDDSGHVYHTGSIDDITFSNFDFSFELYYSLLKTTIGFHCGPFIGFGFGDEWATPFERDRIDVFTFNAGFGFKIAYRFLNGVELEGRIGLKHFLKEDADWVDIEAQPYDYNIRIKPVDSTFNMSLYTGFSLLYYITPNNAIVFDIEYPFASLRDINSIEYEMGGEKTNFVVDVEESGFPVMFGIGYQRRF